MNRLRFTIVAASLALGLAGCHADVTYRFDVHSNNTMTVTAREVIDDQLYQMALSQQNSSDPFGFEEAKANGWDVARASDENGNHIITMTRTLPVSTFAAQSITAVPKSIGGSSKGLTFDPGSLTRTNGLFSDTEVLKTTIPALIPKSAPTPSQDESENPFGPASQQMAAAMITSMIGLHMELRTPGKVVATNGETTH